MKSLRDTRGFTLIELLVVIAVLAILIALLVPLGTHTLWVAKKMFCASNLRQIHMGITAAAGDHNGQYLDCRFGENAGNNHMGVQKCFNKEEWPQLAEAGLAVATSDPVYSYVAPVWKCPDRAYEPQIEPGFPQLVMGYQYFGGIETWNTPKGRFESRSPVNTATAQGRWCLAADAVGRIDRVWGGGRASAYKDMPPHRKNTAWPVGGNVCYVDGSVKWVKFDDMVMFHSWSWGGRRDYFSQQDDLGAYHPDASHWGRNNKH